MKIFKTLATMALLANAIDTLAEPIKPETATAVALSSRDTNRVVCSEGPINDIFYSEEKGIKVQIDGNNAYIKFMVKNNGIRNEYVDIESEFFITCAGETYTLIASPRENLPAKTYRLGNSYRQRVKHLSTIFGAIPLEEQAIKATQLVYKGDEDLLRNINSQAPLSDWHNAIIPDALIRHHATYAVDGFGLRVKEFRVKAQRDIESLQEIQFLNPKVSKRILAITLIPHALKQGGTARVFIVEREFE